MNILIIIPYIPSQIFVRPYNLIRYMAQRGNHATLLALYTKTSDLKAADVLRADCEQVYTYQQPTWRSFVNCLKVLPGSAPLQAVYCWQSAAARQIETLLSQGEYDVVHVEHLRGVKYALHAQAFINKIGKRIPVIWDSVDCISNLFRQAAAQTHSIFNRSITRMDLERTARYEGWLINQFPRVLVTSPVDRNALLALKSPDAPEPHITVLPNGVDLAYFTPEPSTPREPATLVVTGKMSYHANATMITYLANEIMPLVWNQRSDVKLWVVGKDPSRELLSLTDNPAIAVTGTVEDIRPFLRRATLAVAPILYGAGIQNKVLQAMACATPVICTPQAISALGVQPDRDICVAEGPVGFAQAILDLLADSDRRSRLGAAGLHYVQSRHNWSDIAADLENIYRQAAQETYSLNFAL
jgi:glycosyltransferase involved in cell wall biosynthesis